MSRSAVKRLGGSRLRRNVRVAAEGEAAKEEVWTVPTLDPNTPSPIFGGSTGGLLRKAQVGGDPTESEPVV